MLTAAQVCLESAFIQPFFIVSEMTSVSMAAGCLILSLLCPCPWHQRHKNVKWMWEKKPCPLFITLNHFLQISQDHDYWMHLSFSHSTAGQRLIASARRFKDFPTTSDRSWQSLILLNANCPLSWVHGRQTCAHRHTHIECTVAQTWKCNAIPSEWTMCALWNRSIWIVRHKVTCAEKQCVDCEWEQVVTGSVVHSFILKELRHTFHMNLMLSSKAFDYCIFLDKSL